MIYFNELQEVISMPIVTVSERGQLVIPQRIRDKFALHKGSKLLLEFSELNKTITLSLIEAEKRSTLRGILKNTQVLEVLKAEHRKELERDQQRIQSPGTNPSRLGKRAKKGTK